MKTKTEVKHTPTPWHLNVNGAWADSCKDRGPIFVCPMATGTHIPEDQNEINAAFIVKAVNVHGELVEAASMAQGYLATLEKRTKTPDISIMLRACIAKLQAALAKAEGR